MPFRSKETPGSPREAERYLPCDDLWVVTSYFNPAGFRTPRQNYCRFADSLASSGIRLFTVECAFGDRPFELDPGANLLQVRTPDVLWQKERLINLAVSRLPERVDKVAWIDCDLLFDNPAWAVIASAKLDQVPVVQLYGSMTRLAPGREFPSGRERKEAGYVKAWLNPLDDLWPRPSRAKNPGGAWAARRSLFERCGIYDGLIVGGGDFLFACALTGRYLAGGVRRITGARVLPLADRLDRGLSWLSRLPGLRCDPGRGLGEVARRLAPLPVLGEDFLTHYLSWAEPFWQEFGGRFDYVPGEVIHLWHGKAVHRQYQSRYGIMARNGFDPATDVRLTEEGTLAWASDKPRLHQDVIDYFCVRREDGAS